MLLRAVMTTSFGLFCAVVLGALTTKLVSVFGGPAGLALYGQLRQLNALLTNLATVNGGASLVRALASRPPRDAADYLASVIAVTAVAGCLTVLGTLAFAPVIAEWVFRESGGGLAGTVRLLTLILVMTTIATTATAILTGLEQFRRLALLQTFGAASSAAIAYPVLLVSEGASWSLLVILGANPLMVILLGLVFIRRSRPRVWPTGTVNRDLVSSHLGYSIQLSIVATVQIFVPMSVRALYIDQWGLEAAGWFEASYILGAAYVGLFLQAMTSAYLPRLSRESTAAGRSEVFNEALRLSLGIGAVLIAFGLVTRSYLLVFFFSEAFLPSRAILWWMLVHDLARITAWCFGVVLLSTRDIRTHLAFELLAGVGFVGLVAVFIDDTIEIAGMVYLGITTVQAVALSIHVCRKHGIIVSRRTLLVAGSALALVLGFAALSSAFENSDPAHVAAWCAVSVCYLGLVSNAADRKQVTDWCRSVLGSPKTGSNGRG